MRQLSMTPLMRKYYEYWLNTPTLLENPRDTDRFYQFIKACMRGRKRRYGGWLRSFLERDLKGRFNKSYVEFLIQDAVSIFDHIVQYEDVEFPLPLVELQNPIWVRASLERLTKEDGSKYYTKEEIDNFIVEHFGKDQEKNAVRVSDSGRRTAASE